MHFGFLLPLAAFCVHQWLQYGLTLEIEFLDSHLDPFCASAMACYLISIERWYYFGEQKLSWIDMIILAVFLSLVSELLFPFLSDRFTSDWIDVLAISLGAIWFMITASKE